MSTLISVQDIRTSLASITERVEGGESFMVIRNSKPSFMITPVDQPSMVRETAVAYKTKADRISAPPASVLPTQRTNPLRQDISIKGAKFTGDPCSPVDEKDWPKENR